VSADIINSSTSEAIDRCDRGGDKQALSRASAYKLLINGKTSYAGMGSVTTIKSG